MQHMVRINDMYRFKIPVDDIIMVKKVKARSDLFRLDSTY